MMNFNRIILLRTYSQFKITQIHIVISHKKAIACDTDVKVLKTISYIWGTFYQLCKVDLQKQWI